MLRDNYLRFLDKGPGVGKSPRCASHPWKRPSGSYVLGKGICVARIASIQISSQYLGFWDRIACVGETRNLQTQLEICDQTINLTLQVTSLSSSCVYRKYAASTSLSVEILNNFIQKTAWLL